MFAWNTLWTHDMRELAGRESESDVEKNIQSDLPDSEALEQSHTQTVCVCTSLILHSDERQWASFFMPCPQDSRACTLFTCTWRAFVHTNTQAGEQESAEPERQLRDLFDNESWVKPEQEPKQTEPDFGGKTYDDGKSIKSSLACEFMRRECTHTQCNQRRDDANLREKREERTTRGGDRIWEEWFKRDILLERDTFPGIRETSLK